MKRFLHFFFHDWSNWSEPVKGTKTMFGDGARRFSVDVQTRTCKYCNIQEIRQI